MKEPVGIDYIGIYLPETRISLTGEFAEKRGIDPKKLIDGIGVKESTIPGITEDAVTMGTMAAWKAMAAKNLSPKQIGRIDVGTETGVDASKPNAAYILGALTDIYKERYGPDCFRKCRVDDHKMACAAATCGLEDNLNWIRSGANDHKYGIVIATDVAKYKFGSTGEPTQGSGAVALLISENPDLFEFDEKIGICTRDEKDFYRPPIMDTPIVDGKYSERCYMEAMAGAYEDYCEKTGNQFVTKEFDYFVFHLPFPVMAEKAAAHMAKHEWRYDKELWTDILAQTGKEPEPKGAEDRWDCESAFLKKFRQTHQFREFYNDKIFDSTVATSTRGNIYNGSWPLGLISLLKEQHKKEVPLEGKKIAIGSYGSGCSAHALSGKVQQKYKSVVESINFEDQTRHVGFDEYQKLHREMWYKTFSLWWKPDRDVVPPKNQVALVAIEEGLRKYAFIK